MRKIYFAFIWCLMAVFPSCEKDLKTEIPYQAAFVSSPDYYFMPYFQITNISRSQLSGLEVECQQTFSCITVTVNGLNPGERFTIGNNDGIFWYPGDKARVKLKGNKQVMSYTFWYK